MPHRGFLALVSLSVFMLAGCSSDVPAPSKPSLVAVSNAAAPTTAAPTAAATSSSAPSTKPAETSTSTPSAQPTPEKTEDVKPEPSAQATSVTATAGQNCGLSNTGRTTLVVAEGKVSCTEVQETFAAFNAQFSGGTSTVDIDGYKCHSYTTTDTEISGRTVTCENGDIRLEAMTEYPLGGAPMRRESYSVAANQEDVFFGALGSGCHIGLRGVDCMRGSNDSTRGTFEFFGFSGTTSPTLSYGGGNPGPNPYFEGPTLEVGQSITAFGQTCLNDGTYLTCQNSDGSYKFRASRTDFEVL